MKITEKRTHETGHCKIKGRILANGSKQRSYKRHEKSNEISNRQDE